MANRILYGGAAIVFLLSLSIFYLLSPTRAGQSKGVTGSGDKHTILDSAFWSSEEEGEPDFAALVGETNLLSGEPYTMDEVERIRSLWRLFPENSLLPRPSGSLFRREKEQERLGEIAVKMARGDASPAEVNQVFEARRREIQDRIQLVEHVLTETWPEATMNNYQSMLARDRKLLIELEEERRLSLELLERRKNPPPAE